MTASHARYIQSIRGEFHSRVQYDLMMAIALDTGLDDEPVVMGYTELAEKAGCHRNSVGRNISKLVEDGLIRVGGTEQKRVYYMEVDMDFQDTQTNRHNAPLDVVTVQPSQPSQSLAGIVTELSQIVTALSQIVHQLSQIVTVAEINRHNAPLDVVTVDAPLNNNINNNYYYSDPTVTTRLTTGFDSATVTHVFADPDVETVMAKFTELTGFFSPHETTDAYKRDWRQPIESIVRQSEDVDEAIARITHSINVSRGDNAGKKRYIVKSPRSILVAALNWQPNQAGQIAYDPTRMLVGV